MKGPFNRFISLVILAAWIFLPAKGANPAIAYDMGEAMEICTNRALDNLEGIWIYPDDGVTVLIMRSDNSEKISSLPEYTISVIEGEDCRLLPGDIIGNLKATAGANSYTIELFTEEKNRIFLKPYSCLATLSRDGDELIIKKQKSPFKFRLNLNFNRLLTGFWKIASIGINRNQQNTEPPAGMVKIFPSYDGNGSSKRSPRYL